MNIIKKRKITLVLGGGSARGFANIGVLKSFDRHKIPIDLIIGSSMGAAIAAAYSTKSLDIPGLEKFVSKFTAQDLMDVTFPTASILKGEKLAQTITRILDGKTFDDCRIPVAVATTDIISGEEVLFTSGNLVRIITASCSWPGFFPPVKIDGRWLCDGGIKNSVPAKWAKKMAATFTIAVKVGFAPQKISPDNIFQLMSQSFQIMGEELDKYQSMQADIIIDPDLTGINQLDFDKGMEIILKGEAAAESAVKKIKSKLGIR